MRHALIVWGGWMGHQPDQTAQFFAEILRNANFQVTIANDLEAFAHLKDFPNLKLLIPIWTMGEIAPHQLQPVLEAVQSGVGLAGCHGGMCDSFRNCVEWHFMTGGQWVAHPGGDGVSYWVRICREKKSPITERIPDFEVVSEQYYMHVDPAINVLATTRFPAPNVEGPHVPNGVVEMPVVWTKFYGKGRVFYCSLGHQTDVLRKEPVKTLMARGFLWSARAL
jgi:type 1 glutamine amidotransferase